MKIGLWRVLDQSDKVARVAKIVKNVEYVFMVMAAVDVLLDAAKIATQTRKTIKSRLDPDELERNFVIIEIFLSTFVMMRTSLEQLSSLGSVYLLLLSKEFSSGSPSVRNCLVFASEFPYMVFDTATVRRAGSAIAKGEDYQRPLIEQLD